jgi:hypothetical protein
MPRKMFTAIYDAELEKPNHKEWIQSCLKQPELFIEEKQMELFE